MPNQTYIVVPMFHVNEALMLAVPSPAKADVPQLEEFFGQYGIPGFYITQQKHRSPDTALTEAGRHKFSIVPDLFTENFNRARFRDAEKEHGNFSLSLTAKLQDLRQREISEREIRYRRLDH